MPPGLFSTTSLADAPSGPVLGAELACAPIAPTSPPKCGDSKRYVLARVGARLLYWSRRETTRTPFMNGWIEQ
jgi:hypothetical protein